MEYFYDALIEAVRNHPCIYDKKNHQYKDNTAKNKAWDEVAEITGQTVEECCRKWMTLRERYNKEAKKRNLPTGSQAVVAEDWPFYDNMSFLKEFIQPRVTRKNIFPTEIEVDSFQNTSLDVFESDIECSSIQRSEDTPKKRLKSSEGLYDDACEAVKSAAEAIQLQNQIELPIETCEATGGRRKITENFVNTILGMLEPLSDGDQDYAFSQILNFVVALRQDKLFRNNK